ncbi:MBOAT family O-acyltransferase [Anaerophilus nitritogenes]|uniref:MBOAT family O-acyltransferase n=1 Tax=Anaerophilus nitritogenes TaxID=2498136 RepID=UPI00101C38EA|nr:MBOAT family protein [Anaerophilus nitritogenes]
MLFSSIVFLFYFLPIVIFVYYSLSFSRLLQNIWLFISSILFYAWGEPIYVLIMLFSILFNTLFGFLIEKNREEKKTVKILLVVACCMNLGLLVVFKYLNFIIENVEKTLGQDLLSTVEMSLPIGISFFTFQALSYVIDVYRGKTKVEKNPFYVGLYISFFPQLIAGPIIQYNNIVNQIRNRKSSWRKFSVGACRFVTGLGKKLLLANNFAIMADNIFNWSTIGQQSYEVPVMLAWLGAISYTLQIFFDFSAYSDMAIGLGLMFGFKFEENFNYPYISKSMTEFWRRWHISLSTWFREYVYFPLGGSRVKSKDKVVRNLFVVWILTGMWHGANWTFLFWGMWNFIFILAEHFLHYHKNNSHKISMHVYTMFIVTCGWVLFKATDLYQAGRYFMNMFGLNNNGFYSDLALVFLKENILWFVLGIILCTPIARKTNFLLADRKMSFMGSIYNIAYPIAMTMLFIICVAYLARGTYNPFIYFNF